MTVTMTLRSAAWKRLSSYSREENEKKKKTSLTGLFYLSPVATCSSVFYLDMHSNWTTFRERFIIPVILSEPFSSLMKPNVLRQTTQLIRTPNRGDWSMMRSSSACSSYSALDSRALSKM